MSRYSWKETAEAWSGDGLKTMCMMWRSFPYLFVDQIGEQNSAYCIEVPVAMRSSLGLFTVTVYCYERILYLYGGLTSTVSGILLNALTVRDGSKTARIRYGTVTRTMRIFKMTYIIYS